MIQSCVKLMSEVQCNGTDLTDQELLTVYLTAVRQRYFR